MRAGHCTWEIGLLAGTKKQEKQFSEGVTHTRSGWRSGRRTRYRCETWPNGCPGYNFRFHVPLCAPYQNAHLLIVYEANLDICPLVHSVHFSLSITLRCVTSFCSLNGNPTHSVLQPACFEIPSYFLFYFHVQTQNIGEESGSLLYSS